MRLLIISSCGYPNSKNLYNSGFVHTRVLNYIRRKHTCLVFTPSNYSPHIKNDYNFENVDVYVGDIIKLKEIIKTFKPQAILIHFTQPFVYRFILNDDHRIPIFIWVHGYGAIGWFRYFFEFEISKKYFIDLYTSTRNLYHFHRIAKNHVKKNIFFTFISKWMKNTTAIDTLSRFTKYRIIPNPIDNHLFTYLPKSPEQRKKILLIRSFDNRKYANDLAVNAILALSKRKMFNDLSFNIYGEGTLFSKLMSPLHKFGNINIENRFLSQKEISILHKENGLFLCPTRMDAQGVSMCEAMMSGLVPITSRSTAIPEFVTQNNTGILTRNSTEIAEAIEFLYQHPEHFSMLSKNAHNHIINKAGVDKVIDEELEFIAAFT